MRSDFWRHKSVLLVHPGVGTETDDGQCPANAKREMSSNSGWEKSLPARIRELRGRFPYQLEGKAFGDGHTFVLRVQNG